MTQKNNTPKIKAVSPLKESLLYFLKNKAGLTGSFLVLSIVFMTFAGPILYETDPFEMVWMPMAPPFEEGAPVLGTDQLGRDILAGIINGAQATLAVGLAAAMLTLLIGVTLGSLAGYYGGKADTVIVKLIEFFQILPPLLFAMVIIAIFTPTLPLVAFSIGIVSWPSVARLARAEFMSMKNREFVLATKSNGASDAYLILRVILPNAAPPLIIASTLNIATAILFESGLSFLGLSDPNIMSWGYIIGNGRENLFTAWWISTIPGIAILLTSLGVSLIGSGLNDALNPKLRKR